MFKFEYKLMTVRALEEFRRDNKPKDNSALVQNQRTWTMDTMKQIEAALTSKRAELFCFLLKTANNQTKGTDYQILGGGTSLKTLYDFVEDRLELSASWLDQNHWKRLNGKTFTQLPPQTQEAFLNHPVSLWVIERSE